MAISPGMLLTTPEGLVQAEARPLGLRPCEHPLPLVRTKLDNGLEIATDANQRFRVVPHDSELGTPVWRSQRVLRPGDRVLLDYQHTDCPFDPALFINGTAEIWRDPHIWIMLGYARASGYFPSADHIEDALAVRIDDRRDWMFLQSSAEACRRHDLDFHLTRGEHPKLAIYDYDFQRALRDFGFRGAADGEQNIPTRLFRTPAWIREAFLTGYFSAHGEWKEHSRLNYATPLLIVSDDKRLRLGLLSLLWSVGVAAGVYQRGWERLGHIAIRDIPAFQDRIGFMQAYKSRKVERHPRAEGRWDALHRATALDLLRRFQETPGWKDLHADEREVFLRTRYNGTSLRRSTALDYCRKLDLEPPEAIQYHHAAVDVTDTDPLGSVLMYEPEGGQFVGNHAVLAGA